MVYSGEFKRDGVGFMAKSERGTIAQ